MAKKSDQFAGFEAEDTGGLFSSLLAEESASDPRRTLWRVASWGGGAVAAVVVAVMANQSSLGGRREQAASADLVQQANRLQAAARESQNEARRLASAVEILNSDRDRLYTRVTVLEQGLDSVTGAIAKQKVAAAAPAPFPADAQPAIQPTPQPPVQPVPQPVAQPPAPAIAPAAAKAAAQPEKISAAASAEPAPASTAAIKEVPTKPAAMPATPLVESKSMMSPPDPAAGKLIEAAKAANTIAVEPIAPVVAAATPGERAEQDAAEIDLPRVQRTEFGVDVGSANSIAGLRALWRGLLKSRSNAPLLALQPLIVIREGTGGRGMQLRLVAGPLSDAATAAKLCAAMSENGRACETTVFDGQRLTFQPDDASVAPKPAEPEATRKKNASQKRAAAEQAAKRSEAATPGWSPFGKKN